MEGLIKWCLRTLCMAVLWVFLLSITWNGRPVFYYANDLLVQNELVRTIDVHLADLWEKVADTAKVTFERHMVGSEAASI